MKTTIESICLYTTSGATPTSTNHAYYNPPTIPWLRTKEVNFNYIYDTEIYISEEGLNNSSTKLIPENSVIVAMYGQGDTAGRVAINKIPLCTNQACCNLIIDPDKADYRFVFYALSNQYDELVQRKNGGAQPNLNSKLVKTMEIPIFSLETQRKIAEVLSTFDLLIENNRKQIKLLEEAAQRLYKEWFIDLRFPGHENVEIDPETELPKGWKADSTVGELIQKLESGKRPKGGIDKSLTSGVPSIGAENVIGVGRYNYDSEKIIPVEYFEGMRKGVVHDKDILVYKDGAYTGRVSLIQDGFPYEKCAVNEHVFLVSAKEESDQYWLYFTLEREDIFNAIQKVAISSAQPGINQDDFKSIRITIPTEDLRGQYSQTVSILVSEIILLAKQNRATQLARERLLPKLMEGEIKL